MTLSRGSGGRARRRGVLAALLVAAAVFAAADAGRGHVPVPDSVLDPRTPAEAWNVIRLSSSNVERLLRENRLPEIPDQVSLCSPALRALTRWALAPGGAGKPAAEQAVRAAVDVGSLAQASLAGDRKFTEDRFRAMRATVAKLAASYDARTIAADIFCCPMHPDFVSTEATARCGKCGMSLVPRRIPHSFVYVPPGEPTTRLTAVADGLLTAGQPARVTIRLDRRDGAPVLLPDLLVMHTQPIHLLIVDRALADYHHEHPTPTGVPGEYCFSFIPAKNANYRIFADIVPAATGVQEYPFTDLPGSGPEAVMDNHAKAGTSSIAGGLNFQLSFQPADSSPPRAGQVCRLQVAISDAGGKPVEALEPVMNAFAHLVGFYDDYRTIVHLHPGGGEITSPDARGGPMLEFKLYPPKAGLLRLYCQVQVRGKMIFAPFDLDVVP